MPQILAVAAQGQDKVWIRADAVTLISQDAAQAAQHPPQTRILLDNGEQIVVTDDFDTLAAQLADPTVGA